MASGNTLLLLTPHSAMLPGATAAGLATLAGASTPAEALLRLTFDSATTQYCDWLCKMPAHYAGGGITLRIVSGAGATTNGYVLGAALRKLDDDAEDIDTTSHSYSFTASSTITPPTAIGEVTYDTIAITSGANMDSVGAGDAFILRLRRDTAAGGDTMAATVYVDLVEVIET